MKPPRGSCEYDMWVASSKSTSVNHAVVEVKFISIRTGREVLPSQRHAVDIQPNGTTVICEGVKLNDSSSLDAFVIFAKLLVNERVIGSDADWPQPYKYISFEKDRGIHVHLSDSRDKIEISATKPTKGLTFSERPGLSFSDNGFDVLPGEEYIIDVKGLGEHELLEWTFLGANECHARAQL
jgi:beta-mannosidase